MLTFFIGDLLPIIVIMLLGYFSGRLETFSEDLARAFNKLVLKGKCDWKTRRLSGSLASGGD